jgi:hypothetical protein
VVINDVPISGVALSQIINESETIDSTLDRETIEVDFNVLRIAIPQGVVIPGQANEIEFLVDMRGDWGCDLPNFLWATISKDSLFFLPQDSLDDDDYFPLVSLADALEATIMTPPVAAVYAPLVLRL